MLESGPNRRKNARLVAQVMSDRNGKISRSKVDGHVQNFWPAIPNCERSQIGLTWSYHQSCMVAPPVVDDRGSAVARLLVRSIAGYHDWSYDRSMDPTIDSTIGCRTPPLLVRSIVGRNNWSHDRSLIATSSRMISYDGSCHRYCPIVRDRATTRTDQSRHSTAPGDRTNTADRSNIGQIASNHTIRRDCGFRPQSQGATDRQCLLRSPVAIACCDWSLAVVRVVVRSPKSEYYWWQDQS